MCREVQAEDIELGHALKSALVDELGFPVAEEGTIFHSDEERTLVLRTGRCFWVDDMGPLKATSRHCNGMIAMGFWSVPCCTSNTPAMRVAQRAPA